MVWSSIYGTCWGGAAYHSLTPPLTHTQTEKACFKRNLSFFRHSFRSDNDINVCAHWTGSYPRKKHIFLPKMGGAVQIGFSSFFYLLAKLSFSLGFKEPFFRRKVWEITWRGKGGGGGSGIDNVQRKGCFFSWMVSQHHLWHYNDFDTVTFLTIWNCECG